MAPCNILQFCNQVLGIYISSRIAAQHKRTLTGNGRTVTNLQNICAYDCATIHASVEVLVPIKAACPARLHDCSYVELPQTSSQCLDGGN